MSQFDFVVSLKDVACDPKGQSFEVKCGLAASCPFVCKTAHQVEVYPKHYGYYWTSSWGERRQRYGTYYGEKVLCIWVDNKYGEETIEQVFQQVKEIIRAGKLAKKYEYYRYEGGKLVKISAFLSWGEFLRLAKSQNADLESLEVELGRENANSFGSEKANLKKTEKGFKVVWDKEKGDRIFEITVTFEGVEYHITNYKRLL